ncbi:MAG TPA: hypothetical protein VFO73_07130 [Candidatus Limnocylindrales bacterium]|nr:hypothetical protein [Candidatus Limnocylindrales bacterium]
MIKRTAASALWFFAVATGWNLAVLAWDLPSFVGIALAASVALFVWADPRHLIWERATESTTQPATATLTVSAGLPNQG